LGGPKTPAFLRQPGRKSENARLFRVARSSASGPLVAALIAVLGSTVACDRLGGASSPLSPTGPPAPGSTIAYTAVGASDAIGIGSSSPCMIWSDCPDGLGYVQVATKTLRSQGFAVSLLNLGIPTAVIGPDFQTLGVQYGREIAGTLIEQEMPFVQQNATVVSVFVGGNDVNTITAALGGGAGAADQQAYIDAKVKAFGADYKVLLDGIRSTAKNARVIVLNLPNMGALPYLAGKPLPQRQAAQLASVAITTTVINPSVDQRTLVIDLMCDARAYEGSYYSADGFHPSDAGYAFIAAELVRAIGSNSYPAPNMSCAQMRLVP
jgi:lysophospholipase L1-like esterase